MRHVITEQGFGFVEFQSEIDAEYAVRVCGNITLYGKKIKVNKSNMDKRTLDVGANLFIGNLAPEVDEDMLKTTFIAFGQLALRAQGAPVLHSVMNRLLAIPRRTSARATAS